MDAQKNTTLELLKLFASYMVVFIHVRFYGGFGTTMDALARFAVPFFFLISGFFSYKISSDKIKKRIKHIAHLLVFAVLCYTFFNIFMLLFDGDIDGIVPYFSEYLNLKTLIKLFVLNVPVSSLHLWYLFAMLYVYIVFCFVTVFNINEKVMFVVSFFLLSLQILLGECLSAFGVVLGISIVRNFALMGIPFFVLGLFVKKYENRFRTIPNQVPVIAIVLGGLESILSRHFLGKSELYIGSLFILFAFVIIWMKYSNIKLPRFFDVLSGCSTYIYIFHIMISQIIIKIYALLHLDYSSSAFLVNIHPIIVCIGSTVLAYFIVQIKNKNSLKKKM